MEELKASFPEGLEIPDRLRHHHTPFIPRVLSPTWWRTLLEAVGGLVALVVLIFFFCKTGGPPSSPLVAVPVAIVGHLRRDGGPWLQS